MTLSNIYLPLLGPFFTFVWFAFILYLLRKNTRKGLWLFILTTLVVVHTSYRHSLDMYFSLKETPYTFSDIGKQRELPLKIEILTIIDEKYIETTVSPSKILSFIRLSSLRSGMPAYIFNYNGNLIDETIDNLDEARYQEKWENVSSRISVSYDEALKQMNDWALKQ